MWSRPGRRNWRAVRWRRFPCLRVEAAGDGGGSVADRQRRTGLFRLLAGDETVERQRRRRALQHGEVAEQRRRAQVADGEGGRGRTTHGATGRAQVRNPAPNQQLKGRTILEKKKRYSTLPT